jgi:DNA-binding GntR family transcriptional regulator
LNALAPANIMQRVFDALKASADLLTVDVLAERTRFDEETIRNALRRLRQDRTLTSVCQNNEWRYGVRAGAKRPMDRRGK